MNRLEIIRRLEDQELAASQEHASLLNELKTIPHLPLNLDFSVKNILSEIQQSELQQAEAWHPHLLHPQKKFDDWYFKHHTFSFKGQCLVDFVPDNVAGMSDFKGFLYEHPEAKFDQNNRQEFFVTPLGEQIPSAISALHQISPYINRTRVIKTPPGGGIPWHSHHLGAYRAPFLRLAIVHIPLISNAGCMHGVKQMGASESAAVQTHYEPGQAYLFNSWHEHSFWNRGAEDRVTIIAYFNFTDEALLSFLRKQVDQYQGPRLPLE